MNNQLTANTTIEKPDQGYIRKQFSGLRRSFIHLQILTRPLPILLRHAVTLGQFRGTQAIALINPPLLAQSIIGRLDGGEVSSMAIDHDAYAQLGKTLTVLQLRVP